MGDNHYICVKNATMITGEIKAKIDLIWEDYWTGGITNSISVLEQMTYLFFIKLLDDAQQKAETNANLLGTSLVNPTFPLGGLWHHPGTDQDVPYERLRWHLFRHDNGTTMFQNIHMNVFPFIKNLMLHSVDNPDIEYKDSLSTDNTDSDRYTLCLAN